MPSIMDSPHCGGRVDKKVKAVQHALIRNLEKKMDKKK